MKIAFQMEDPATSDIENSNSLVLAQEAQARGHDVFHYLQASLSATEETAYAMLAPLNLDLAKGQVDVGAYVYSDLSQMDAVMMREEPPVDMCYITATFMLDMLRKKGVYVSNDPFWIRNTTEKLSILHYPDFIPPCLVSQSPTAIEHFLEQHQDVVVKPLYLYQAKGVFRSSSLSDIMAAIENQKEPMMLQKFLPQVKEGTKRIVVIDGEPIGGYKKYAEEGSILTNTSRETIAYELSERDKEISKAVGKDLKEKDQVFAALDLIGDYLIEINVTSPAGIRSISRFHNTEYHKHFWDIIEQKISEFQSA